MRTGPGASRSSFRTNRRTAFGSFASCHVTGVVYAAMFYLTSYRAIFRAAAPLTAPRRAKVITAISLCA